MSDDSSILSTLSKVMSLKPEEMEVTMLDNGGILVLPKENDGKFGFYEYKVSTEKKDK